MTRVVLVPGVLALLPAYAGLEDPVAELRAACLEAVAWLGSEVEVRGEARVASYLLGVTTRTGDERSLLVVANGSARRTEKAPGHLDERAVLFDDALGAGLRAGEPRVDRALADELWADVAALDGLSGLGPARVDYDEAPFGVQYWVMRWIC